MRINIETNLNNFNLPAIARYDNDYYVRIRNILKNYMEHISEVKNLPQDTKDSTRENIEDIYKSLELYNNAMLGDAKNCIKKIICKYYNNPFIVSEIDKSYAFRGIAPFDSLQINQYKDLYGDEYKKMNSNELNFFKARLSLDKIERRDMLHIPFDKRGLISTQRYSIAGVPCIYLSTTTFGCWIEMGIPEPELFNVASYKIPSDFKMLNLCISQYLINGSTNGGYVDEHSLKHVCSLIEIFPLVCATSLRVLEKNRSFKSEYIVSQLLMQAINELGIDSIAYLSKRIKDYYAYSQAVNIAIPMQSNKLPPFSEESLDMYCTKAKEIILSDAIKYSDFLEIIKNQDPQHENQKKSYVNEIYKDNYYNKVNFYDTVCDYNKTNFSKFDDYLVNQRHYEFE